MSWRRSQQSRLHVNLDGDVLHLPPLTREERHNLWLTARDQTPNLFSAIAYYWSQI